MLKILCAGYLSLSSMISAHFTLKMCVAAWNAKKSLKSFILGFKVVLGYRRCTRGKLVSSACYDNAQAASLCLSATVLMPEELQAVK